MYLNKNTTPFTVIENPRPITIAEIDYPKAIFSKYSEAELNALKLFTITEDETPNRRYYIHEDELDNNRAHITRTPIDRAVADVQELMYTDLAFKATENEEAGITVGGLEIATDAISQAKLTAGVTFFGRNPNETRRFKHKNGFADATEASTIAIQDALATHIENITQGEEAIYVVIKAFTTVQQCVDYEHEADGYIFTAQDELDGFGVEGEPRYKNNVKEW